MFNKNKKIKPTKDINSKIKKFKINPEDKEAIKRNEAILDGIIEDSKEENNIDSLIPYLDEGIEYGSLETISHENTNILNDLNTIEDISNLETDFENENNNSEKEIDLPVKSDEVNPLFDLINPPSEEEKEKRKQKNITIPFLDKDNQRNLDFIEKESDLENNQNDDIIIDTNTSTYVGERKTGKELMSMLKDIKSNNKIYLLGLIIVTFIAFYSLASSGILIENPKVEIAMVKMPDLTNISIKEAELILDNLNIKTQVIYQYDKLTTKNHIIKSNADYGQKLKKGERIILYVSNREDEEVITQNLNYPELPLLENKVRINFIYNQNDDLYLVIENKDEMIIKDLEIVLGYINASGNKVKNKTINISDINLAPGQQYELRTVLDSPNVTTITIEEINKKSVN